MEKLPSAILIKARKGEQLTATATLTDLTDVARSDAALRAFLHGLPGVDKVDYA